jgi:predicted acetyltransferase
LPGGLLSAFDVRRVENIDEFIRAILAIGEYFGMVSNEERMLRFTKLLPLDRMYGAWSNEAIVGGAGSFPFDLTVPGSALPTAGVTVVGVLPTHRRRGVLRSLRARC